MKKVHAWFEANHLLLTSNKTSYKIFDRGTHLPSVLLSVVKNENVLNIVDNSKFLGIIVDYHKNFKSLVEFTLAKLAKCLCISYKNRSFVPTKELVQIYYLSAYPHFIYGMSVWSGCYETTLKPIKKNVAEKMIRAIVGAGCRVSAEPIYQHFFMLKFEQL